VLLKRTEVANLFILNF